MTDVSRDGGGEGGGGGGAFGERGGEEGERGAAVKERRSQADYKETTHHSSSITVIKRGKKP